jgi:hypothetical protein
VVFPAGKGRVVKPRDTTPSFSRPKCFRSSEEK